MGKSILTKEEGHLELLVIAKEDTEDSPFVELLTLEVVGVLLVDIWVTETFFYNYN